MANFFRKRFELVFPGLQAPPKNSRPKFMPKLVGIPLQFLHFFGPKMFSRQSSAYEGDQQLQTLSTTILLITVPTTVHA